LTQDAGRGGIDLNDAGALMPGFGELILFIVVPLGVLFVTYRIGHRIGKAEGRLQGRDEAESRRPSKTGS